MTNYSTPHRLAETHVTTRFACGALALDDWLQRFALTNQRTDMTLTYVTTHVDEPAVVAGFYSLSAGGVEHAAAPSRVTRGVAHHQVPVIVLTRLAVDLAHQGRRVGTGLLHDALHRVATAAELVGVRALALHAKDEAAREFYLHHAEFEPSPIDPFQLFLLIKDLRRALAD